jgi:hypothetical protein
MVLEVSKGNLEHFLASKFDANQEQASVQFEYLQTNYYDHWVDNMVPSKCCHL